MNDLSLLVSDGFARAACPEADPATVRRPSGWQILARSSKRKVIHHNKALRRLKRSLG
jgi:hypothetical protein